MIEYFLANMWQIWAVIAIVCLILELSSGDFFIICFSIGAVFAIISAICGLSIYWQIFIFAIFSLLSVLFVRPVALRYLHKNEPTNSIFTCKIIIKIFNIIFYFQISIEFIFFFN